MAGRTIHFDVDIAIILMDATTGRKIERPDALFYGCYVNEKKLLTPIYKGNGSYIFFNMEKEDFKLLIKLKEYENISIPIRFDELNKSLPEKYIYMLPTMTSFIRDSLYTLSGKEKNLKSIIGINPVEPVVHILEYDKAKNEMMLYENGHRLSQEGASYAILNDDGKSFQVFSIQSEPSSNSVIPDRPLKGDIKRNSTVCRVTVGQVEEDGSFIFRIQKKATDQRYLLRLDFGEEKQFKEVDFHGTEAGSKWELQ